MVYYNMKATIVYQNKVVTENGVTEMVIWELPAKTPERPHGIKYRLYHGNKQGYCIVRYDNELGKGDHKHIADKETRYQFVSVEQLMKDFISDVIRLTDGREKNES